MIRIGIFLFFSTIGVLFFLQLEHSSIQNDLICTFSAPSVKKINEKYQVKFSQFLPKNFPLARFRHLSDSVLSPPEDHRHAVCNITENLKYKSAFLYNYRSQIYPLFTDSLETLKWIAVSQHKESIMLNQLIKFKQILIQEKASFDKFSSDCAVIKEISDQIKLLEKHLKIHQQKRRPAHAVILSPEETPATLAKLKKNISRQLDYARKHLLSNEKIFQVKWQRFLKYEPEKKLCPYLF